jgi:transcription termination factor Rho
MVAELAIERAKRLVELGHDVVVLLDSLTRLGRAYNLAAPANGRLLAGGVDATALHPPKKFFGAARNREQGGSLTILATALVDTGSATDEVILEEFTGTANSVLKLDGDIAARRTFPAIDVVASGTRREDLLLTREEAEIVEKLRRSLVDRTPVEAHEDVLGRVRATQSNIELLTQVQRAPLAGGAAKRR